MEEADDKFVKCLSVPPNLRTLQDVHCIRSYFKSIEALKSFKELTISEFSRIARYEHYQPNATLYRRGDVCTSWYIVLSGCVLVGQTMFFPRTSFGHRSHGNIYRYDECVILEKTELIVFDYSLETCTQPTTMTRKHSSNTEPIKELEISNNSTITLITPSPNSLFNNGTISKRSSHASDTSSAYSGCDALAGNSVGNASLASDNEDDDADLDSLSQDIYSMSDTFYDVILKEPNLRNESDIETILDGVQNLPAFLNFTSKTKYEICKVMQVVMVHNSDEKLMEDGQIMDTWNVVLNGAVEVRFKNGSTKEYTRGDSFGVQPNMNEQKHAGEMWTVSSSCMFCCVLQAQFCEIVSRNIDSIIPEREESGKIDLVYEERTSSSDSSNFGKVVVKGTAEKLISLLMVDQRKYDPMYIENFLLTYRVFVKSPKVIADKLLHCYQAEPRDKDSKTKVIIRKILILWANNHFIDLDDPNSDMSEYLEEFEDIFSNIEYSIGQDKSVFFRACSSNSKPRYITLEVNKNYSRNSPFRLIGLQKGWGLFIKEVNRITHRKTFGLRRGDQILSLANHSWERIETLDKATDLLNPNCNCSIELVVRYNPTDFYEILDYFSDTESGIEFDSPTSASLALLLQTLYKSQRYSISKELSSNRYSTDRSNSVTLHGISDHVKNGLNCVITPMAVPRPNEFIVASPPMRMKSNPRSAHTSPTRNTVRAKSKSKYCPSAENDKIFSRQMSQGALNNRSTSNPDLKAHEDCINDSIMRDNQSTVNQVLKVYRPNSVDFKYVSITNNTTAKEIVPLIIKEFSIDQSELTNYSLYTVTVDSNANGPIIKSSRVALYFKDLAGKLSLNQRYYLKNNITDSQLITDEQAKVLLNESKVTLAQMEPIEIATRLTLIDYALFRDIPSAEYINYVFKLPPLKENDKQSFDINDPSLEDYKSNLEGFSNGYENYKNFEDLINRESFWPTTEICMEPNINKRVELIKKFIKVAKFCKDLKNFNSLMCIITGLTLTPVSRLKLTWDKVPNKYIKMYEDLSDLTDMSLNFRRIRQLVLPEISEPPLIPCLALHSKDLAAIHLGNKTSTKDELINFEKLRMMASEIRKLLRMCNTEYNLQSILSSVKNRSVQLKPSSDIFNFQTSPNFNQSMDESDATSGISGCSNNSDSYIKKGRSNSVDQFALKGTLKKKTVKRKSLNVPDNNIKTPRKIYEEWLSTLKFRTYLTNLVVDMNISHLQELSLSLEPSTSSANSSTISNSSHSSTTALNDSPAVDQGTTNVKLITPKSPVPSNVNQTKPIPTSPSPLPLSPASVSSASSQNSGTKSSRPRSRPQSIFSNQNPEDVQKIMNLVSTTRNVIRKQQIAPTDRESGVQIRHSVRVGAEHNYLKNVPLFNSKEGENVIRELTSRYHKPRDSSNSNFIPGGITLNLQQNFVPQIDKTKLTSVYQYPPAGIPLNNVFYAGDRKKCMKPDLPSYETARAMIQQHRLNNISYTDYNTKPIMLHTVVPTDKEIGSLKPPLSANKPPKLPSYNQHVSRTSQSNQDIYLSQTLVTKRNVPPPPPRTVTVQKSNSNQIPNYLQVNKSNNKDAN